MNFTYEKTDEVSGILRNKGRRCGSYTIEDGEYTVNVATASAKKAWAKEMKTKEDINKFFEEAVEAVEVIEEDAEEDAEKTTDDTDNFEKDLFEKTSKEGNILAKKEDGNYVVYKGPISDSLVDEIEKVDNIEKVITLTKGE